MKISNQQKIGMFGIAFCLLCISIVFLITPSTIETEGLKNIYMHGDDLILEYSNPYDKLLFLDGLSENRYDIQKNKIIVFNPNEDKDYFEINIGNNSSISYSYGTKPAEDIYKYVVLDAKVENHKAKKITFPNLKETILIKDEAQKENKSAEDYFKLEKTKYFGDVKISLKAYQDITRERVKESYDCKCKKESINQSIINNQTGKNETIEKIIETCETCRIYENYTVNELKEINPETFKIDKNTEIYEVFEGCSQIEKLPDGKWGCRVFTDVDILNTNIKGATWWNSSWDYRVPVEINSTSSINLTNFPAKCVIDTQTLISAGKIKNNCEDIRISDNNGSTLLSYEIEGNTCNTTNTIIWFKKPNLITPNDTVYIYYGSLFSSDNQNPPDVWSNNYVNVWHFNNITDSVGGLDWTNINSIPFKIIDNRTVANLTASSSQKFSLTGSSLPLSGNMTITTFFKPFSTGSIITTPTATGSNGWAMRYGNYYPTEWGFGCQGSADYKASWGHATINQYLRFHVTRDVTAWSTWEDGVFVADSVSSGCNNLAGRDIGQSFNGGAYMSAYMDELRWSNVKRSLDWINAEANQLYKIGSEENYPDTTPPTSNHPSDAVYFFNTSQVIGWVLYDETASGNYTVFRNGTVQNSSISWTNNTNLGVWVNTSTVGNDWNYTIKFNDSSGNEGIPDTVFIDIVSSLANFVVTSISPEDGLKTTDNTTDHIFNVSGSKASYNCTLYYNNLSKGNNISVLNNTETIITSSQVDDGFYNWSIECISNLTINQSEVREIGVGAHPPNCSIQVTPSNISANTTGNVEIILTCEHPIGINTSRFMFTNTVEGFTDIGTPNVFSIRPPENNRAINISDGVNISENILVAGRRNLSRWFEDTGIFTDIFSYSARIENDRGVIINNTSTTATFNLTIEVEEAFRNMVYLDREKMYESSKSNYIINKNNPLLVKFWEIPILRQGNNVNFTAISFRNLAYSGNPVKNALTWYCNSSYNPEGSIKPTNSTNCVYTTAITKEMIDSFSYTVLNSTYNRQYFGIINGKIAGIQASSPFYVYFESKVTGSQHYYVRYANTSSGTNVSFNETKTAWSSTDDGVSWVQINGTMDMWVATIRDIDQLQFGIYVESNTGTNYTNLTFYTDDVGYVNFPITVPSIKYYCQGSGETCLNGEDWDLNGTYTNTMAIHIGASIDPNAVGTVNHSLYLCHTNGSIFYTINNSFYSYDGDIHMDFDTKLVPNGIYKTNVTAIADDNHNDTQSDLTFANFTIFNAPPEDPNPVITPSVLYTNTSANCTATFLDNDSATGTLIFRWYIDSVLSYTDTKTSVVNDSMEWSLFYHGNFSKNEVINCTVLAIDENRTTTNLTAKTVQNTPPSVVLNYPTDGATGLELNPYLNITYFDIDGDVGNVSFYGIYIYCYQESANISTACGGLDNGTYGGDTGDYTDYNNAWDGNWTTRTTCGSATSYLNMNYTKLVNSSIYSLWLVSEDDGSIPAGNIEIRNLSISTNCWNQDILQLRILATNLEFQEKTRYYCYNGTGWDVLYTRANDMGFREEAMWWNIPTLIGNNTSISNGSYATFQWQGLDSATFYEWYIIADDGDDNVTSDVWNFTTTSIPEDPNPVITPIILYTNTSANCSATFIDNDNPTGNLTFNWYEGGIFLSNKTPYDFHPSTYMHSALTQIDDTHYLTTYGGGGHDGFAMILFVNGSTGEISNNSEQLIDKYTSGNFYYSLHHSLAKIDDTHYLEVHQSGLQDGGGATVLTVNPIDWTISNGTEHIFTINQSYWNNVLQIDNTHFINTYASGQQEDLASAIILIVNETDWTVSNGAELIYANRSSGGDMIKLDNTHFLNIYGGYGAILSATILTVNETDWTISNGTDFTMSNEQTYNTAKIIAIDDTHFLCSYRTSYPDALRVSILTINRTDWTIISNVESEPQSSPNQGDTLLAKINNNNYVVYQRYKVFGVIINLSEETVKFEESHIFNSLYDRFVNIVQINSSHYLNTFEGGYAIITISNLWKSIFNESFTGVANNTMRWSLFNHGNFSKNDVINCTVIASDIVSSTTSSTAKTVQNTPPSYVLNYPQDGATGLELNPYLNITYYDIDGDVGDIQFINDSDNLIIGNNNSISNGSYATFQWQGLSDATFYEWYIIADDGDDNVTSDVWNFTTTSIPEDPNSVITPSVLYTNTSANCSATFIDNDNPTGNLTFQWYLDSVSRYNESFTGVANNTMRWSLFNHGNFSKNQIVNCTVIASDIVSNRTGSTAKTVQNTPPSVVLNYPTDGATGIELNPYLNITYYDIDGDVGNISFINNSDDSLIGDNNSISNGSYITFQWQGLDSATLYNWFVNATDGDEVTTSDVWNFTTNVNPLTPIITIEPHSPIINDTVVANANSTDADNDTLTYYYRFYDNTTDTNLTSWTIDTNYTINLSNMEGHNWIIYAYANDGELNSSVGSVSLVIINLSISLPELDSLLYGHNITSRFNLSINNNITCYEQYDNSTTIYNLGAITSGTHTYYRDVEFGNHTYTVYCESLQNSSRKYTKTISNFMNVYAIWDVVLLTENDWDTPFNVSTVDNGVDLLIYCEGGGQYYYTDISNVVENITLLCDVEFISAKLEYTSSSYFRSIASTGLNSTGNISIYLIDAYQYSVLEIPILMTNSKYYDSMLILYKQGIVGEETHDYIITQGYFDIVRKFPTYLTKDNRYLLRLVSDDEIRDIGWLYAFEAGEQSLDILQVSLTPSVALFNDKVRLGASYNNTTDVIRITYEDLTNLTQNITFEVLNETGIYFKQTYESSNVTVTLNGVPKNQTWAIIYEIYHPLYGNSPVRGLLPLVKSMMFPLLIGGWLYGIISFVIMFFTASIITPRNLLAGYISMFVLMFTFIYIGWLPLRPDAIVIISIILILGMILHLRGKGEAI